MKKTMTRNLILLNLAIIPILYTLVNLNTLPQKLAIHYNLSGEANSFIHNKLLFVGIIALLTLGTYLFFFIYPIIDPNKNIDTKSKKYFQLQLFIQLFVGIISLLLVYSNLYPNYNNTVAAPFLLSLFMVVLGNYLKTVKPNYFFGLRTPWTLANHDVWVKTHKRIGLLMFIMGAVTFIFSFILSTKIATIITVVSIIALSLLSWVYSFYLFKQTSVAQ